MNEFQDSANRAVCDLREFIFKRLSLFTDADERLAITLALAVQATFIVAHELQFQGTVSEADQAMALAIEHLLESLARLQPDIVKVTDGIHVPPGGPG